ncbi:MAG TPA: glycosyltransferase family 87 protein, partial [Blastocatellia bacterium]|nr:glycosyltransferase family 87 protein [Blastocatellia bacterium]
MSTLNSEINGQQDRLWLIRALDIIFLSIALVSLTYAVITAPRNGIDFLTYHKGASEWIEGAYSDGAGALFTYPPFTIPLISPVALISFERARILWLGLNLAAAAISIYLVLRYFKGWPPRAKFYLALALLSLAPFRVTLRVGQISLIITALLLGAILARARNRKYLAGALLGISLCKFTLSFPFFLYFLWKKEWKMLAAAIALMTVLTYLYALRLGVSLVKVAGDYLTVMSRLPASTSGPFTGSTEIKPLLIWMTGGDNVWSSVALIALVASSLIVMALAFARRPGDEQHHFAIISLFALWTLYHRTYDSVLYVIPIALLIDFLARGEHKRFSRFWLAATGLLVFSIPGLLTSRLGIDEARLSGSAPGLLGLHLERILTLGMFA